MRTTFRAREPYAGILQECADAFVCNSPVRPERFITKMRENRGVIAMLEQKPLPDDGMERRNPVIVALGDSVTAGHFENLLPETQEQIDIMMRQLSEPGGQERLAKKPRGITDARESYIEKFRLALIDRYECTSVSVINAGIAGDHLISMSKRAERDVIRYQPDLVLINGSLNWNADLGTAEEYKQILKELVQRIKRETDADIVLLTPNGDVTGHSLFLKTLNIPEAPSTTHERVPKIREVAQEEQVCLADVYAVWEMAREMGCPWEELLANRTNHPGVEGHEVYAKVLMKLFD